MQAYLHTLHPLALAWLYACLQLNDILKLCVKISVKVGKQLPHAQKTLLSTLSFLSIEM